MHHLVSQSDMTVRRTTSAPATHPSTQPAASFVPDDDASRYQRLVLLVYLPTAPLLLGGAKHAMAVVARSSPYAAARAADQSPSLLFDSCLDLALVRCVWAVRGLPFRSP